MMAVVSRRVRSKGHRRTDERVTVDSGLVGAASPRIWNHCFHFPETRKLGDGFMENLRAACAFVMGFLRFGDTLFARRMEFPS